MGGYDLYCSFCHRFLGNGCAEICKGWREYQKRVFLICEDCVKKFKIEGEIDENERDGLYW